MSSEEGFVPPGDDSGDGTAAQPEPNPAGYISPDPHDGDPGLSNGRKRSFLRRDQPERQLQDEESESDCDSTHTPDSIDDG